MRIKKNDIRLDNIHYWPTTVKKIVLVIIGFAVILLGLLLENHLLSSIETSYQQTNQLKKELLIKKTFSIQTQDDLKRLSSLQQQENELTLILPDKPNVTEIIQSLSNVATLEPLTESTGNFYRVVPIHGFILGNYQQIGQFINDLSTQPRLMNIGDFDLETTKDNGVLSFDFLVNGYYYDAHAGNTPHPPLSHFVLQRDEAFIFTRDPFLPMGNEIGSGQCLLCDAPIHALKMAGTMTVDGKLWALVQSPSSISTVKVGDKIGEEQISITTITAHSVVLNNHFSLEMNHS